MKKIVIIGSVWPEPHSTAAGQRMMQLIAVFKQIKYQITFACSASKSIYSCNLDALGIESALIELNHNSFDAFIKDQNPHMVLFDRFMTEEQFGWRVMLNCPDALRMLDSEDLHFLREARHECYKKNSKLSLQNLQNDTAKREIASVYRCDLTLMISTYEMDLLTNTFLIAKELLHYIPMIYDAVDEEHIAAYPKFEAREHFFSIGNFYHKPNWETVLQLKNTFWPLIKKQMPKAELHIYGAYMPEKAKQLHNVHEGFIVKGRAENSAETFKKHRVLLAPIPFGAGIKGKLLQSMLFGTPSLTSTTGAEAMHDDMNWNGCITNDPALFASQAVSLYNDEALWKQAQTNGIKIINTKFNKTLFETQFVEKLEAVWVNLENHRAQNFMGQLIQHHTLKSTMYMSKWIEEKNKPKW